MVVVPEPVAPALLVVALGGNALLRRGEAPELETQRARLAEVAIALAELAREYALVVTHGNGPQVGLLALQAEAWRGVRAPPLDVLGAESEGLIGYLIEQQLENALPGREVVTLLTQVEVDPHDPAFARPSKPIGPVYDIDEGQRLAETRGFVLRPDGDGLRRVVPSPEPRRILELRAIRRLLAADVIVIAAGGGGIPVAARPDGRWYGVEAVVDKDLSAALLAEGLGASLLLLLTDVAGVYVDWQGARTELVRQVTPAALRGLVTGAGSMAPKVEAACRFVERTGGRAAIGALEQAVALARGQVGTQVTPA
jgi:carbamate kinase